ncbi:MAG: BolA family protein, partial [Bdellovibrionota bacterium]
ASERRIARVPSRIARFELVNESHAHSVGKNSETHFKMVLVSARFDGLSRIQRQRLVNDAIADELKGGVHAFTQRTLTPAEWEQGKASGFESPDCHGGSKHDKK